MSNVDRKSKGEHGVLEIVEVKRGKVTVEINKCDAHKEEKKDNKKEEKKEKKDKG